MKSFQNMKWNLYDFESEIAARQEMLNSQGIIDENETSQKEKLRLLLLICGAFALDNEKFHTTNNDSTNNKETKPMTFEEKENKLIDTIYKHYCLMKVDCMQFKQNRNQNHMLDIVKHR